MSQSLREDVRDRIANRIVRGPFGVHVGLVLQLAEPDHCIVRLPIKDHVVNARGIVHGGAIATLIDAAATAAAWATNNVDASSRGTTVGFTSNFLSPGRGDALLAEANVISRGGTLSVIQVMVRDSNEIPVATGLATYKLDLVRAAGSA